MNTVPERIPFSGETEWNHKIRRKLEALSAGKLDALSLDRFYRLTVSALSILTPFLNSFEGGWCEVEERENTLRVTFSTPLFFPEPSLKLPQLPDSKPENSVLSTIRRCLYETAALGNGSGNSPALADGLLHFGILRGTGYYWSLSDHRSRLQYGEHPHTFDELSRVVPTPEEETLKNLKLIYDNNELELTLCLRFPQEEN
jgi:hypothetical protein